MGGISRYISLTIFHERGISCWGKNRKGEEREKEGGKELGGGGAEEGDAGRRTTYGESYNDKWPARWKFCERQYLKRCMAADALGEIRFACQAQVDGTTELT